jgi:antitoxin HigA-1
MMMRLPKNRPPSHPGDILRAEFLEPLGISQSEFARRCGFSSHRPINELINHKRGVSTEMSLVLSKALGPSPAFWSNLQRNWELWHTLRNGAADKRLDRVERIHIAG